MSEDQLRGGIKISRPFGEYLLKIGFGFRVSLLRDEDPGHPGERRQVAGLALQGGAESIGGLARTPQLEEEGSKVVVSDGALGLELDDLPKTRFRFLRPSQLESREASQIMQLRVRRCAGQRRVEKCHRFLRLSLLE